MCEARGFKRKLEGPLFQDTPWRMQFLEEFDIRKEPPSKVGLGMHPFFSGALCACACFLCCPAGFSHCLRVNFGRASELPLALSR